MTIQEAINQAIKKPISELDKFFVTRKIETLQKIIFQTGSLNQLAIRNLMDDPDHDNVILTLDDILATDWEIELRNPPVEKIADTTISDDLPF